MRILKKISHAAGYAIGVVGLVFLAIADDIATRRRNKSGANREF